MTMNLHQKLIEVRKEVPYLKKGSQGNQYKYVSSSQTLGAIKDKMNELNILLIPRIIAHNVRERSTTNAKGNESVTYFTEIDFEYTFVNAENPTESIACPWYGQGVDIAGEKGVGKAATYAEKYFILKFFNVPTGKDDPDAFQQKVENGKAKQPETINSNQLGKLRDLLCSNPQYTEAMFCKVGKIKRLEDLLGEKFEGAIDYINAQISELEKAA